MFPRPKEVWVGNAQDGTISIIDLPGKKVVPDPRRRRSGANRLKFTPDGKRVLVSTLGGPDLVILDAGTRKESNVCPLAMAQPDRDAARRLSRVRRLHSRTTMLRLSTFTRSKLPATFKTVGPTAWLGLSDPECVS